MPRRRLSFATVAVTGLGAFVAAAVGVTLYVSAATGWRSTQALIGQQTEALLDALEQRFGLLPDQCLGRAPSGRGAHIQRHADGGGDEGA